MNIGRIGRWLLTASREEQYHARANDRKPTHFSHHNCRQYTLQPYGNWPVKSTESNKRLYVVATPIGNLSDISQRAIDILKSVDLVLCENTEHSLKLLNYYGIKPKKMKKLTDHESENTIHTYLAYAENIAVISDAGTPLVSDPGHRLVSHAYGAGFSVMAVPGPSALIAALSVCPFEPVPFSFVGFPPRKKSERIQSVQHYASCEHTVIYYESPRRILGLLEDIRVVFGDDHPVFVIKELTKRFETHWAGSVVSVLGQMATVALRGEFVVIIDKRVVREPKVKETDVPLQAMIKGMLAEDMTAQSILKICGGITSMSKNQLYQLILAQKQEK